VFRNNAYVAECKQRHSSPINPVYTLYVNPHWGIKIAPKMMLMMEVNQIARYTHHKPSSTIYPYIQYQQQPASRDFPAERATITCD